jgi:predicted Zn-ribbon and HTH transcriptional regulator
MPAAARKPAEKSDASDTTDEAKKEPVVAPAQCTLCGRYEELKEHDSVCPRCGYPRTNK